MLCFPNAKINLGLQIVSKRTDGYHNISSVFYPIGLSDALEILPQEPGAVFEFQQLGLDADCDSEDNLVVRAYRLLERDFSLPPLRVYLKKTIPMGAGLGGGSSDASCTLKGLNEFANLDLSISELERYALQLGADCPFFIHNKACLVSGVGENIRPIDLSLSAYYLVLLKPDVHISTAMAYRLVKPQIPLCDVAEIVKEPIETWRGILHNDFELSVFSQFPEIAALKEDLYEAGALYASMSGSGAGVYGVFRTAPSIDFKNFVWAGYLA